MTGILNFINKVVVPGRTFTRRMYSKLTLCGTSGIKLKQHHHVRLDSEFVSDCHMWLSFLEQTQEKICELILSIFILSSMTGGWQ